MSDEESSSDDEDYFYAFQQRRLLNVQNLIGKPLQVTSTGQIVIAPILSPAVEAPCPSLPSQTKPMERLNQGACEIVVPKLNLVLKKKKPAPKYQENKDEVVAPRRKKRVRKAALPLVATKKKNKKTEKSEENVAPRKPALPRQAKSGKRRRRRPKTARSVSSSRPSSSRGNQRGKSIKGDINDRTPLIPLVGSVEGRKKAKRKSSSSKSVTANILGGKSLSSASLRSVPSTTSLQTVSDILSDDMGRYQDESLPEEGSREEVDLSARSAPSRYEHSKGRNALEHPPHCLCFECCNNDYTGNRMNECEIRIESSAATVVPKFRMMSRDFHDENAVPHHVKEEEELRFALSPDVDDDDEESDLPEVYNAWCRKLGVPVNVALLHAIEALGSEKIPPSRIRLSRLGITDSCIVPLMACLAASEGDITAFDLRDNAITDVGVVAASTSLMFETHLKELDLRGNKSVSTYGVSSLIKLASTLPSLVNILLDDNLPNVTSNAMHQLRGTLEKNRNSLSSSRSRRRPHTSHR